MDFCLPLNCIDSFPDNRFEDFQADVSQHCLYVDGRN